MPPCCSRCGARSPTTQNATTLRDLIATCMTVSQEVGSEAVMDRMKKILSSPITKKRALASSTRYFGVPLEDIVKREGSAVPFLVQKICHYIQTQGITSEGIFRINGNSRVVERLRTSFDRTGDADLAEAGDVMAVAGLLKLYLRELPEGVIPDHMTQLFVTTQLECSSNVGECITRLKVLLRKLPKPSLDLLKFLSRFLVVVAQNESQNKMNPVALGIVFGPNLFRCSGGIEGLRQQGVTNQTVLHFITQYDALFLEPGDVSPYSPTTTQVVELNKTRSPPPRPPPPSREGASSPPIPSPRKMRSRVAALQDSDDIDTGGEESSGNSRTPRLSDDEFLETYRSASPFVLDSDRSESSALTSPMASISVEAVEKAISHAVSRHMFGEMSSEDETTSDAPIPAPRKKRRERAVPGTTESVTTGEDGAEEDSINGSPMSIKARIERFEDDTTSPSAETTSKPGRTRPRSKAFDLFESQGLVITPASGPLKVGSPDDDDEDSEDGGESPGEDDDDDDEEEERVVRPLPKPRALSKHLRGEDGVTTSQDSLTNVESDDSGFSSIQRNATTLTAFKRAPGPKNRRTPSRRSLRLPLSTSTSELLMTGSEQLASTQSSQKDEPPAHRPTAVRPDRLTERQTNGSGSGDENHNAMTTKPSINFLNIHLNGSREERTSPDRSPVLSRKPYVPPLDLSILHEHGDGSDPIPAEQGPSMAIHKVKTLKDEDIIMLSPRTSKLKKKTGRIEDDQTYQIKQLTKKIQSCKRKIKVYEESFEEERGYRPSQTDKAANPDVKKTMQDLAKARKEFRRLKEEVENFEHFGDYTLGSTEVRALPKDAFPEDGPPRMEDTLEVLLKRLEEKRREAVRTEDLDLMAKEQVVEEKLAVQKALLQYENLHGRPTTKYEKELMKPLYDRYRQIKRILAKPASPRERSKPLESVPEDHTVEFAASPASSAKTTDREAVHIPTAAADEPEPVSGDRDFLVTRDFGLLMKETLKTTTIDTSPTKHDLSPEGSMGWNPEASPLHELSLKSLLEEQQKARQEKKRLRRVLREFEDDFVKQTGRKVQKDDRAPMDAEYYEYKQVKAKLKLLEALLSKHDKTGSL